MAVEQRSDPPNEY